MTSLHLLIGKLRCLASGKHLRGKRVGEPVNGMQMYKCGRCGAVWSRQTRKGK